MASARALLSSLPAFSDGDREAAALELKQLEEDIELEARWIWEHHFAKFLKKDQGAVLPLIVKVLHFIRKEHLEGAPPPPPAPAPPSPLLCSPPCVVVC